MEFAGQKSKALQYSIIVRNNKTLKSKSIRVDSDINETKLLVLIKQLLKRYYEEKEK